MPHRLSLPEGHAARRHNRAIAIDMAAPIGKLGDGMCGIDRLTAETVAIFGRSQTRPCRSAQHFARMPLAIRAKSRHVEQTGNDRQIIIRCSMDGAHLRHQGPGIAIMRQQRTDASERTALALPSQRQNADLAGEKPGVGIRCDLHAFPRDDMQAGRPMSPGISADPLVRDAVEQRFGYRRDCAASNGTADGRYIRINAWKWRRAQERQTAHRAPGSIRHTGLTPMFHQPPVTYPPDPAALSDHP